jgi:hypothetical protein
MTFTGKPWLGESYSIDVTGVAATELAFMLIGFDTTSWLGAALPFDLIGFGAPGCLLYLAPNFNYTQTLGTGPSPAPFTAAMPTDQVFLGFPYYHQAFVVDAGTFAFGGTELATAIMGIK